MPATVFEQRPTSLSGLLSDIDEHTLALPEIQRPFVWSRTKVRDLLDSMYRGYPVGYLLLWKSVDDSKTRSIGATNQSVVPTRLIVDGQQRLTSLYAVMRGVAVVDESYKEELIQIAFRPADGKFEVSNAATIKDPEFLSDISVLWAKEGGPFKTTRQFLKKLRASRAVDDDEEEHLTSAIDRLHNLQQYDFSALELSAKLDEEQVAEIFVRINSEGVTLNQADFILTLMSVFWDRGRHQLEDFAKACVVQSDGLSPRNEFIRPGPDQLLRVAVGLGFERGALSAVYALLRGRDIDTKQYSADKRDEQFRILQSAQEYALDLTNWHEFLKCLRQAGYRNGKMISSQTNLLYAYVFFLIGKRRFSVPHGELRDLIARWFFMTSLTARYTSSSESALEKDLSRLRSTANADEFVTVLNNTIALTLTPDYWNLTLPNLLATSSTRGPNLAAYEASQNLLGANAFLSKLSTAELSDLVGKGHRSHMERHHLFPKDYLKRQGIQATSEINQIANLALAEWTDNADIAADAPSVYWVRLSGPMSQPQRDEVQTQHALPSGWPEMSYRVFLDERRKLMARMIRRAYERLDRAELPSATESARPELGQLIDEGEGATLEFKSTARWNVRSGGRDERMENKILVTLAGFMNAGGGTLIVGVDDHGSPLGLEGDYSLLQRKDADGWRSWLTDHVSIGIDKMAFANLRVEIEKLDGVDVCRITVRPSTRPVWVKGAGGQEFYVRADNSTRQLLGADVLAYVADRWGESSPKLPGGVTSGAF
jgi:hypothetical protein